jgi:COP9 signalosome complex subunit 4
VPRARRDGRLTKGCFRSIIEVASDSVPLAISRPIISEIAQELPKLNTEMHKSLANKLLVKMHVRVLSFEEQSCTLREQLSIRYSEECQWAQAAETLSGIDIDSAVRRSGDTLAGLKLCLQISDLYMKAGDFRMADSRMSQARLYRAESSVSMSHEYHVCWANVYDRTDRFLEASNSYSEASRTATTQKSADAYVSRAIICAILAPLTPQKRRALQGLLDDERSHQLKIYCFLQKVCAGGILRANEVQAMREFLQAHHLEAQRDGLSVFQRAIAEHNLLSMSKVYMNMNFDQLGEILNVNAPQAEKVTARLISDGCVQGCIDQVDRLVYFDLDDDPTIEWDEIVIDASTRLDAIKAKSLAQYKM